MNLRKSAWLICSLINIIIILSVAGGGLTDTTDCWIQDHVSILISFFKIHIYLFAEAYRTMYSIQAPPQDSVLNHRRLCLRKQ